MNKRLHILFAILLVGIFAYFFVRSKEIDASGKTDAMGEQFEAGRTESSRRSDSPADQQQTRARIDAIGKLESRQALRARAQARHGEEIPLLQARAAVAWSALLNSNRDGFMRLTQKAATAPSHAAHCTLCDGTGMLDSCVLCGHTGKCVRCEGSGYLLAEYCPACLGTGKCGVCFGTGKMPCPFCDDGAIEFKAVFPPALVPVH